MRTQTVNIDQAKNQLAELIAWAAAGGEILILDNGKALARLGPPGGPAAYGSIRQPHLSSPAMKTLWPGTPTVGRMSREAWRDPLVHLPSSGQTSADPDSHT